MNPNEDSPIFGDEVVEPRPIQFPCLLWEPSLDAVLMCNEQGVGMVLRAGRSKALRMGMIVPYGASRWCLGGEEWDFILPPPQMTVKLQNVVGPGSSRPLQLGVDVRNLPRNDET